MHHPESLVPYLSFYNLQFSGYLPHIGLILRISRPLTAQGQVNSTGKEANVCSHRCRMAKYTLVCVRHGESEWNQKNLFCGWHDADLSTTGVEEAKNAGKVRS